MTREISIQRVCYNRRDSKSQEFITWWWCGRPFRIAICNNWPPESEIMANGFVMDPGRHYLAIILPWWMLEWSQRVYSFIACNLQWITYSPPKSFPFHYYYLTYGQCSTCWSQGSIVQEGKSMSYDRRMLSGQHVYFSIESERQTCS